MATAPRRRRDRARDSRINFPTRRSRPIRHDLKANDTQIVELRRELHTITDHLCDQWQTAQRQAAEMGRGYPSATLGDGGSSGGGELTSVERVALSAARADPALRAQQALSAARTAVTAMRQADRMMRGATHTTTNTERQNNVEKCAGCGLPILAPSGGPGRVKRLGADLLPYHHPDPVDGVAQPQCWWDAYRAQRREAG